MTKMGLFCETINIYRRRYPREAGILPLGEPSKPDAEKAIRLAKKVFQTAKK